MKKFILLAFLFCVATHTFGAFGYYSPLNINSGQVPSTQTNFPVLVSVTDARLKTVANGGHVQDAEGDDIRPYTDTTLGTAITGYEKVFYSATAGTLEMWVKVSSLSSSSTPFVLAYGDASLTADGSSTTTWSNSFIAVYHLKDGTTFNVTDSTGSFNGTNHSATATTGQIDGGGGFVAASTQYVDLPTGISNSTVRTVSAWAKATTFPALSTVTGYNNANSDYLFIFVDSSGKVNWSSSGLGGGTGSHTLVTGTWYHLVWTKAATTLEGYVNAASDWSANGGFPGNGAWTANIGRDNVNARYWNGSIDEVRYSSVNRTANWITTEYNNQSAPGTFETLGTEVVVGPVISPNRVTNFFFSD